MFKTQLGEREPDLAGMEVLDAASSVVGRVVSRFGQAKWKAEVSPDAGGDLHLSLQRLHAFRF